MLRTRANHRSTVTVLHCCCRYRESVIDSCHTLVTLRSLTVAVYVVLVTVQRYHLFVWTVFSPKLLYEAVSSLVTSVFVTLVLVSLTLNKLQCGPMPNVMAALPNIGGALCSTPQSLADAHY